MAAKIKLPHQPCCPVFDPATLDEQTQAWQDRLFVRDEVRQLFHIPLNMGKVVTRMWERVQESGAAPKNEDFLLLAYDPSPWKSELYMTVTREVEGTDMARLSGVFVSKVFDGPYNAVPRYLKEMESYLRTLENKALKYYIYYTYCPKCAKVYGHNYCVVFAQVS
ncbi:hypothetical protein AUK40_06195 [Candidatus Wirthbacteria bacterium CG2_30_54_11]|uniref:Uncharacterized protein n=1 Tax=Candidatus Wirthbacteria bacterium CG2_30_54_11 TaxID=1817892 RepID=A0A1J5IEZ1_9BACT|nr:MAG: hypothetical protein AUK40_06195 [Candidatus Wirthbacteria bacterium CG2_30_54_11]